MKVSGTVQTSSTRQPNVLCGLQYSRESQRYKVVRYHNITTIFTSRTYWELAVRAMFSAHPSHTILKWVPLFSFLQRNRETPERWSKSVNISQIETDSTWFKSWSFWFGQRMKKVKEKTEFKEESRSESSDLSPPNASMVLTKWLWWIGGRNKRGCSELQPWLHPPKNIWSRGWYQL